MQKRKYVNNSKENKKKWKFVLIFWKRKKATSSKQKYAKTVTKTSKTTTISIGPVEHIIHNFPVTCGGAAAKLNKML